MRLQMIQVGATTSKKIYELVIQGKLQDGDMNAFAAKAKENIIASLKTQKFILNVVTKERGGEVKSNAEVEYEEFPSSEDLTSSYSEVMSEIQESRKAQREPKLTARSMLGGAVRYNLMGGVFVKGGTINTELGANIRIGQVKQHKVPTTNDRYVGVELEIASKLNHEQIAHKFAAASLHKHVNVGTDGSINADSGGSGTEVRILMRESEVKEIMTRVCAVLNSPDVQAYVNDSCGVHVHIDCRNRNAENTYKGLVRGLPLLTSMVPQCRKDNRYCRANTDERLERRSEKYWAINPNSFQDRKTIEVRLHSGSTNAKKVINWVSVLVAFANNVPKDKITTLDDFKTFTGGTLPADLYTYMEYRIKKFKTNGHRMTTAVDDVTDHMLEEQGA